MKNRLDQIEHEAVEANEQWDRGRGAFNANHHAPPIDIALANGERTLAALRAVLDVCETYPVPSIDEDVTGYALAGMERLERLIRAAIHDALWEEA